MRYFAITLITFIIVIGVSSITNKFFSANAALDIDDVLNRENQRFNNSTLMLSKASGPTVSLQEVLAPPISIPAHAWIEQWRDTEKEALTNTSILRHLNEFNEIFTAENFNIGGEHETLWLTHYLQLRIELQSYRIELSRYLVSRSRQAVFIGSIIGIALIVTLLTFAFFFVFRAQRQLLNRSHELNQKLETQRATLLASQRAMVSITDDEQRAIMRAEQLANLVEQSSEAFVRINHLGQVLHYNKAATKLFEGIKELSPHDPFVNLFPGGRRLEIEQSIKQALRENSVRTIRPSGHELESAIELTITRVVDTGPQSSIGVSILARDVSAQVNEQNQLTKIIENAPNALFVCNDQARITVANQHAEKLFGYVAGGLIGELVDDLVSPGQRVAHTQKRREYLKEPEKAHMGHDRDLMALRQDGSEFPVEIGLNPMIIGKQVLIVASIFDLTSQHRQQQDLEIANQKLKMRNDEMEQFVYTVSHDLKSPLFTISGFTHQLKDSIIDITEEQIKKVERIQFNIDRMGMLLDDLLQLSRVIRVDLERSAIDTNRLIENVLATIEGNVRAAGAEVSISKPLDSISANEGLVFQCTQNLITNALKHVREGVSPKLTISSSIEDGFVKLDFADNGPGVAEKHRDRIFRIFQRLGKKEGTGVGLAIVKTVMERHNGTVMLRSEPGEGSTFSLLFPQIS